jgi:2-hydroxychromene-2-carboxylate isomerase
VIEVFFDCSSPWTYLAFHNIQPLAAELGEEIRWRPFMVGGVFNTINPSVYEQRATPVPAKARYMKKDLEDWARVSGITIRFPPRVFPVNSVKVMRACLVAEPQGALVPFATAAFEAYWRDNLDISADDVFREVARRASLDGDALLQAIAAQEVKDRLKANTDELIARGGFGSPTIFVDGNDMYFGNDRLELVRAAILGKRAA